MLDVHGLKKSFYGATAVDDISFRVESGEVLGFLGPNGAGKTTTMRMITGFLPPTAGRVVLDDIDMWARPKEAKRLLGYLPETLAIYPEMRVREYVRFRAELCGVASDKTTSAVDDAMQRCFVDDVADKPVGNLSKGYRQRVGLAGALVHRPKVLVLDEPTIGLDPRQIVKIRDLIRELRKEQTILFSTHILPEVELVCDRVLIIDKGRIVATGTPETLRQQMSQVAGVLVALKGEIADADSALRQLPGVLHAARIGAGGETRVVLEAARNADLRETIFKEVVARGWTLLEMTPRQASLEEVFVRLLSTASNAETPSDGMPLAAEAHEEEEEQTRV